MRLNVRIFVVAAICLTVAAVLFVLYQRNPAEPGNFPPCPFLWLTGLYCPGCGALRTMHELLHLHFARALQLNPLVVITSLPLALYFSRWLLAFGGLLKMRARPLGRGTYYSIIGVILIFWFLRNIPQYPFSLLAPH